MGPTTDIFAARDMFGRARRRRRTARTPADVSVSMFCFCSFNSVPTQPCFSFIIAAAGSAGA